MNNGLIANLIEEDEIELIYSTTNFVKDQMHITYTIVCDIDNIVSNINLFEKIVATMFIIKDILSKYKINFSYKITTSHELDKKLFENSQKTIEKLSNAEILYCKENSLYEKLVNENNSYIKTKRA